MHKLSFFFLLTCLFACMASSHGVTHEWTEQLGTTTDDGSYGASADGLGSVYITGYTEGDLGGPNAGSLDAFVSKYDSLGNLQWSEQLGTTSDDVSLGVSADGLGYVYITGYTKGNLSGPNAGSLDAFVSKYDSFGNLQWTKQLGTPSLEASYGVSADGLGNVYISGFASGDLGGAYAGFGDAFVSKYDTSGNLLWTEQLGSTSIDYSYGVSADGLGNVYITGYTNGDLGGPNAGYADAFVSMYDSMGNLLWAEQLGSTSIDYSYGVSADGLGNVYISGQTGGDLSGPNAGSLDAFVSKYDSLGNLQWSEQLGTTSDDVSLGVSADGLGNIYIAGVTGGDLGGSNADSSGAFVSKYDSLGNPHWSKQLTTTSLDASYGVSADGLGNVYISGRLIVGDFVGPIAGRSDAFVAKFSETTVPEPSTLLMGILAAVGMTMRRRVFDYSSIERIQ